MAKPSHQTADRDDPRWPSLLEKVEMRLLSMDEDAVEMMRGEGGETMLGRIGDVAFPFSISVEEGEDEVVFVLRASDGDGEEPFEVRRYRWAQGERVVRIG